MTVDIERMVDQPSISTSNECKNDGILWVGRPKSDHIFTLVFLSILSVLIYHVMGGGEGVKMYC